MAKLLIDLTPLYNRKVTGLEIYGIEFYKGLLKTNHEIIPIFRKENTIDSNPNSIVIPSVNRLLVENFYLPTVIKKTNADIAFFPIFPPPLNIYNLKTKIIPTIHDLAFQKYSKTLSWKARLYLSPKYNRTLSKAKTILTISDSVREELNNVTNANIVNWGNNISTEYILDNNVYNKEILKKFGLVQGSYYISVSTIEPRKNIKYLFRVWKRLIQINPNLKLVLTGRAGWGNDRELKGLFEEIKSTVLFTDYVEFDELINLYHFAKAFILLSVYEGFGRTPIEALACGSKVIVSDIPIFKENLGENALFVPLDNVETATEKILDYIISNQTHKKIDIAKYIGVLENNIINNIDCIL